MAFSDKERWTYGDQPLPHPIGQQAVGWTKFGLGVGALSLVGRHRFASGKLGFDYYGQAIRAIEEYSPGKIFRTFQFSSMISTLETASQQMRYFDPKILTQLRDSPAGRVWLDHLTNLIGSRITNKEIMQQGFRFENGQLLLGRTGSNVLLKHAAVIRPTPGAAPKFSEALYRSLGASRPQVEARSLTRALSEKITYITAAGTEAAEAMMFTGGHSAFEAKKRFLYGYGTSLVERFNQLARVPFENQFIKSVVNKVPILRDLELAVKPGAGLATLGKSVGKLGVAATALYLGYRQIDSTIGISPAIGMLWTRGQVAISRAAELVGLHDYREWQESVAPGSTTLSRLMAFPMMGAMAGATYSYAKRVWSQGEFQRRGLSLGEASVAAGAEAAFFKNAIYGRALPESVTSVLGKESIDLIEQSTAKLVQGWSGKIARRVATRAQQGGLIGNLLSKVGELTPGRMRALAGAAVGAALIAPFLPGALVPSKRPQELEDIYSGRQEIPIRKGRWWEMGRSPYEGSRIDYFRPHWYPRMLAGGRDISIYGEKNVSPLKKWWLQNFTYELEKKHYYDRPYPVTGTAFEDIPLLGPVLGATVGRLVKPPLMMHKEDFMRSGQGNGAEYLRMPMRYGETTQPGEGQAGSPISPYGAKGIIGEQAYRLTEMIGLPGFVMTSLKEKITGEENLFSQEAQLESARRMYGSERAYWDLNLGGMLGTSELIRRLIPHRRREIELYNPIPNTMPSWMPGEDDRAPNFQVGDPFTKVQEGEIRLPGEGYAALHPELKGVNPEDYPAIWRLKILSDVAPYSEKYAAAYAQVRALSDAGQLSENDQAIFETVKEQIKQKKNRKDFQEYLYKKKRLSPIQQVLAEHNEAQKGPAGKSFFDKTIGKYWETLAHNAETPLEYLTPMSPAAKLVHMRTAVEDYKKTQVFGTENAFWGHPIRDFLRPTASSIYGSLGGEGIPGSVQKKRDIEEYFDILKYVKFTRLKQAAEETNNGARLAAEYESKRRETLFGVNPYTHSYESIFRALPRRERDYFNAFSDADLDERAEILKLVPENERPLYIARWELAENASAQQAIKKGLLTQRQVKEAEAQTQKLYEEMDTEGLPKDEGLWKEYLRTRNWKESYADWYRRTYKLEKALKGKTLPGPDWVGWCIPQDQIVLASNSLPIYAKDITAGQLIMQNISENHVHLCYERFVNEEINRVQVDCDNYHDMRATGKHLILVAQQERKSGGLGILSEPKYVPISTVTKRDYLVMHRPNIIQKDNKTIDLVDLAHDSQIKISDDRIWSYYKAPINACSRFIEIDQDFCWLLGYYAAEGNIRYRDKDKRKIRGLQFTQNLNETIFLEKIKRIINRYQIHVSSIERERESGKAREVIISNPFIGKLFATLVPGLCNTKYLADVSIFTSIDHVDAFLQGFQDGDGTKDGRDRLCTTSYRLALQLKYFLFAVGKPHSLSLRKRKNRKDSWIITTKFNKKNQRYLSCIIDDKFVYQRVKKIDTVQYEGQVYDFTIENIHEYLCPIGTYHNSPEVDLEEIKLKVVQNEGENAQDYDLWSDRERALVRRPITAGAVKALEGSQSTAELRKSIRQVLDDHNVAVKQLIIARNNGLDRNVIDMDVQQDRLADVREFIRKRGFS